MINLEVGLPVGVEVDVDSSVYTERLLGEVFDNRALRIGRDDDASACGGNQIRCKTRFKRVMS